MKFVKMILIILIVAFCAIGFIPQNVSNAKTINDISNDFHPDNNEKISYSTLKEVIGKLLGFLQLATGLSSILIIAVSGYNYIIAPTPDLKGEMKRKMLPIVLGLVLVFFAITIANFIVKAME